MEPSWSFAASPFSRCDISERSQPRAESFSVISTYWMAGQNATGYGGTKQKLIG